MTDKELLRRLFSKSVRKELKALLSQRDSRKRAKKYRNGPQLLGRRTTRAATTV
jgi:hypothetical protein